MSQFVPNNRVVNVRQRFIIAGLPGNPWKCPISLSILNKYKGKRPHVVVHSETKLGDSKGYILIDGVEYIMPPHIQRWVFLYDHMGTDAVRPVKFPLVRKHDGADENPRG